MAAQVTIGSTFNPSGIRKAKRELVALEAVARKSGDTTAAAWFAASGRIVAIQGIAATAGAALTRSITLPLALVGGASVAAAIEFESAFTGVEKTVEGTDAQLDALEQGIRDLAKEIPATTTEIAGVAEAAGQLGIQTDNVLEFTETMVDMGETTDLQAQEAAASLAQLANITQMPQDKFDELGDSVVSLGNNMATTESKIVAMGMNIAAAGNQVGMTEDQIMALAATLSSVGVEAQAGGTAISKTLIEIETAVQNGGEELELWAETASMSAEEFTEAWESEPAAALDSVITGLGDMEEQSGSTLQQLEKLGITEMRQRDALLRAAGAGDLLTEALRTSADAWEENSALAAEAAMRYGTNEARLQILGNRVKDVGVEFGQTLAPAMLDALEAAQPILETVGDLAEKFSELDKEQQQQIIQWVAIAAATGPALTLISKALGPFAALTKGVGALHLAFSSGAASGPGWARMLVRQGDALGVTTTAADGAARSIDGVALALRGLQLVGTIALVKELADALASIDDETADFSGLERGIANVDLWLVDLLRTAKGTEEWKDQLRAVAEEYQRTGEFSVQVAKDMSGGFQVSADDARNLIHEMEYAGFAVEEIAALFPEYAESIAYTTKKTGDLKLTTDELVLSTADYREEIALLEDAKMGQERADIALARAQNRLEDAQQRVVDVTEDSEATAREREDAALSLREAELNLEDAEIRVAEAADAANTAVSELPEPDDGLFASWISYYEALGYAAGVAAEAARRATRATGGSTSANAPDQWVEPPKHGKGGYYDRAHLAIIGDEAEYIINPKEDNAPALISAAARDAGFDEPGYMPTSSSFPSGPATSSSAIVFEINIDARGATDPHAIEQAGRRGVDAALGDSVVLARLRALTMVGG